MRRTLITLILLLTAWAPATGQSAVDTSAETAPRFMNVSPQLSLFVGVPVGPFASRVDNVGFGATVGFFAGIKGTPVQIGGELGAMIYGAEKRHEPFSTTIPDVMVAVETSNNIGMGHLVLRLAPQSGAVIPYLDGIFGGKYLFTSTSIRNERFDDGEAIATSTNFDDFAWSYGAGGGLQIKVYEGMMGEQYGSVHLNAGARYLAGSEAEYLKKGSIRRENGQVNYDVQRSRTDILVPQFGVTVLF